MPVVLPREQQYDACFAESPVTMGVMAGSTWRWNPRRLVFAGARYKFAAQMLRGRKMVAEIGCADGFLSEIVKREVDTLHLYDFDRLWIEEAKTLHPGRVFEWDLTGRSTLHPRYDGIYLLDVIEHIAPDKESTAFDNLKRSLNPGGAMIVGAPSLESQVYASDISKAGHVNCKTGERFKAGLERHFRNVFLFGMNDEMLHVGFPQMCHYLLALCTEPY